jgi:LssY-like putative type I secretion system component LssY
MHCSRAGPAYDSAAKGTGRCRNSGPLVGFVTHRKGASPRACDASESTTGEFLRPLTALSIFPFLTVSFCLTCIQVNAAGEQTADHTFRIRLLQPVSSYSSKAGSSVRGMLIESPRCDGVPIFTVGTLVEGYIKSVHKVGMGFRHEVATLEIEFDRIRPDHAPPIEIRARVLEVDNAREKVRNGVIHGIRSNNTPQDHLTSRLQYVSMWDPDLFWILPIYRAVFPVVPEPELYFPAGTDWLLELVTPLPAVSAYIGAPDNREFDRSEREALDQKVLSVPERTTTPKGLDTDVVNLAFIGSREQLRDSFESAGWKSSDARSFRTVLREIHAFLLLRNYPSGPMSEQLLGGKTADSTWEKGLDSIARRDHLRIWSEPDAWEGKPVWLSASTRDIGASLSLRRGRFIHLVNPDIDEERERVVRDLTLSGCVDAVHYAPRPAMPHSVENATGRELQTDGAIAILQLRDCGHAVFQDNLEGPELAFRPRSKFARYIRTQVLSYRDFWRENVLYGAFDLTRISVQAIRRSRSHHKNRNQEGIPHPISTGLASGLPATAASESMR